MTTVREQYRELARARTVVLEVRLTVAEAEALRDGALVCTSADPQRYQAARRALLAIQAEVSREMPRRPIV